MSRARALAARLSRALDLFPFTPLGLGVALGGYWALQRYGYGQIDLILLAIGGLAVTLAMLCAVLSAIGTYLVWRAVRSRAGEGPLRLECGYWAASGFVAPSMWYLPFITIAWKWASPTAEVRQQRRGSRILEEVKPERRDAANAIERRFEVGDMFGLARFAFSVRETRSVRLLPHVGALRHMQVIQGLAAGADVYHSEGKPEGDPFDTRRYTAGDPIRFVLWKVFAKSRNLIVRTPERAVSSTHHTVAYLVAGDGDEPAAGAARVAVDGGALGAEWRIGADGSSRVAQSRDDALEVLTQSARTSESGSGAGLGPFVDKAGSVGRLVVFVPSRPGAWLPRVQAAVRELGGRVDFVVGTDGIKKSTKLGKLLSREATGATRPVDSEELAKVVRSLGGGGQGGPRVVVLDRSTGYAYLPEHLTLGNKPASEPRRVGSQPMTAKAS